MSGSHDYAMNWFNTQEAEANRLMKSRTYGDDLSDLYGKAALFTKGLDDVAPLATPGGAVGAPIGKGLVWNLTALQGHAITFGATRSGKGVASIIPTLLSYSGSMLVIDPKGENAWATMERRKAMGQRVIVLDPWGEVQRRYGNKANPAVSVETSRYNPLAAIDPASDDFADDVTALAEALVISGAGEAHWTESARELIGGLIALMVERSPGIASLGDVRAMLAADVDDLTEALVMAKEANPDSLAARKLQRFTVVNNETNSVRAVASTQTAILDSRRLVAAMTSDENPFNLTDLGTTFATIYLVLPLDRLQTHGRWLRMIITMAIRALARLDTQPPAPVLFCLDEMGTIGALKMVEQAFGLMAGVGIRISGYLQDLKQLQSDYPTSWETFISNASVIQALKVSDKTTSEYLADLMGTTTRMRLSSETMQLRSGKKLPWGYRGGRDPTVMTGGDQVLSRPLMLPQEVRDKIGPNRVLAILPGVGNFMVDRMPYFGPGSIWRGMYRSPPWFAAANAAVAAAPVLEPVQQVPESAKASPAVSVGGVRAWFSGLPVAGKAGVGVGGLVILYLVFHLI